MFENLSSDGTTLRWALPPPKSPLLGVIPLLGPLFFPAPLPYSPCGFPENTPLLEMLKKQRQEELDDLIQVPFFDVVLTGRLSLDQLQPCGEAGMGVF